MKNSKIISLLLISISCTNLRAENNSNFKELMKSIGEKLHKSSRTCVDWAEYYGSACAHNLSDWVNYKRIVAKGNLHDFTDFIQSEKDATFKRLSKEEQQAIKDLNKFYKQMATASKEKQDILTKKFSHRWSECQRIFKKAADNNSRIKGLIKSSAHRLQKSAYTFADWTEYYATVSKENLADWVEYCRAVAKDDTDAFSSFIQDEHDENFKKLNKAEQKAFKELNKFYKQMTSASKAQQDKLVKKFSKQWYEYQQVFKAAKEKIN
jgi:uncharacterized protein Yka (UPF0111/DUF47 family)